MKRSRKRRIVVDAISREYLERQSGIVRQRVFDILLLNKKEQQLKTQRKRKAILMLSRTLALQTTRSFWSKLVSYCYR